MCIDPNFVSLINFGQHALQIHHHFILCSFTLLRTKQDDYMCTEYYLLYEYL